MQVGIFCCMRSLLDLIDFDQGGMARKFLSQKRHGGKCFCSLVASRE